MGCSAVAPTRHAGEFGLDRAAVVMDVGVRGVMPGYQHQLALTRHHLRLAADMQRAVSMHCVRCYGHLLDLFRYAACLCPGSLHEAKSHHSPRVYDDSALRPHGRRQTAETNHPNRHFSSNSRSASESPRESSSAFRERRPTQWTLGGQYSCSVGDAGHDREMDVAQCPPRVMLHSYGGSADMLRAFLKLPTVGGRFYFSFSHVINADKEKHAPAKLLERLRAVPDDRLLLESDRGSALDIDPGAWNASPYAQTKLRRHTHTHACTGTTHTNRPTCTHSVCQTQALYARYQLGLLKTPTGWKVYCCLPTQVVLSPYAVHARTHHPSVCVACTS